MHNDDIGDHIVIMGIFRISWLIGFSSLVQPRHRCLKNMRSAKVQARLRRCADSHKPSLFVHAILCTVPEEASDRERRNWVKWVSEHAQSRSYIWNIYTNQPAFCVTRLGSLLKAISTNSAIIWNIERCSNVRSFS